MLILAIALLSAEAPIATGTDRAYWLVGEWRCESYVGSQAKRTYARDSDGSINMTNNVLLPSRRYVIMRERYEYDSTTSNWTVDSPQNAVWGPMHASAGPWLDKQWVFLGIGALPGPRGHLTPDWPIRMIYTKLGDNAFRQEHQIKVGQAWETYSAGVCTRNSKPLPSVTTFVGIENYFG